VWQLAKSIYVWAQRLAKPKDARFASLPNSCMLGLSLTELKDGAWT